jgi:hypothetical protein
MRAETHRKLDGCRLLLLAACGTGGELEPGREGIAGTIYERQGSGGEFFFCFL